MTTRRRCIYYPTSCDRVASCSLATCRREGRFGKTENFSVHFWMVTLTALLLGSIIWLLVVFDHPFLGSVSIGPEAFEEVFTALMTQG